MASQHRFRSVVQVSSVVPFAVEVMRNVKEGGNTFFNARLFGKHLSQMSPLLGDLWEEVERASPSVQGRRGQFRQGRGTGVFQKTRFSDLSASNP